MDDTHPRARAHLNAMYARLTLGQRMEMAIRMAEEGRLLQLRTIRSRHPEYSAEEAQLALGRLWLGDELFQRVRPDAPLLAP